MRRSPRWSMKPLARSSLRTTPTPSPMPWTASARQRPGRALSRRPRKVRCPLQPSGRPGPLAERARRARLASSLWSSRSASLRRRPHHALASGARTQGLPENIVFDDFDYATTEWEQTIVGVPRRLPRPRRFDLRPEYWVVSPEGATEPRRMWYRYGWQGSGYIPAERTLTTTEDGLLFVIAPGSHQGDGCEDENGSDTRCRPTRSPAASPRGAGRGSPASSSARCRLPTVPR